jgi:hypothetical protein
MFFAELSGSLEALIKEATGALRLVLSSRGDMEPALFVGAVLKRTESPPYPGFNCTCLHPYAEHFITCATVGCSTCHGDSRLFVARVGRMPYGKHYG